MRKLTILFLLLGSFSCLPIVQANEKLTAVRICLANWGDHPFNAKDPTYRVIGTRVKVFGIGGNFTDDNETPNPALVLIKPNVSVMSRSTMNLMNPNGWYCLDNKVNVMSKSIINIHCNAKLASTIEGTTVLGSSRQNDGVTVMGKAVVNRKHCQ